MRRSPALGVPGECLPLNQPSRPGRVGIALRGLILAALWASPSFAGNNPRIGVSAYDGYNSYAMGDINQLIAGINAEVAGSGFALDRIHGGSGIGLGIRVWTSGDDFLLSADVIRLHGTSEIGVPGARLEFKVPANGVMLTAASFLQIDKNIRCGLGIGAGYYVADGRITSKAQGEPDESVKLKGNGHGIHIMGLMTVKASRTLDLEAALGYRYAKTNDLQIDGAVVRGEDMEPERIDWSGFMSRAGLIFYVMGR